MGSFYTNCSITRKTITDGQDLVIQFMLPVPPMGGSTNGNMFVEFFLKQVESDGVEKALESWKKGTETWGDAAKCGEKGVIVSNDGAYAKWIPFGPAIRATYSDCGDVVPIEDEETKKRVSLLEAMLGISFESIMYVATDDRWFTLGLNEDRRPGLTDWGAKGVTKETPDFLMDIYKKLSVTYFHASVYDTLSSPTFSASSGVMKSKYEIEYQNEYINNIRKDIKKFINAYVKRADPSLDNIDALDTVDVEISMYSFFGGRGINGAGPLYKLTPANMAVYIAMLYRENPDMEWYFEQALFCYNISSLNIQLESSYYGSQETNWKGWMRIDNALNAILKEEIKKYYYDDEDE